MVEHATFQAPALTEYEAEQVERIALWKGEHPPVVAEVFRMVAQPVAQLAERVIPDSLARQIIDVTYKAADATAWCRDIEVQAGVKDVTELKQKSLEECDQLALRVGRNAEALAVAEGALTGAGGVFTTLLDVPLLFGVAMRTIIRIGHCYGYPLDRKTDRAYVLGVLVAALA
ncbi:MAG: EcsC family protein, partial [Isosphaeraceae bacterium]|nr:EcsC family protein [Isosphaeraceae bacterium]